MIKPGRLWGDGLAARLRPNDDDANGGCLVAARRLPRQSSDLLQN
jgi:hypothetical protein